MKKVLLTVALCVAATTAFGQKKAVNEAQSIAKGTSPNFNEARSLINGALTNSESKDDAKTWFVAGFIEDKVVDGERTKQMLGQQANEASMYEALGKILPYFLKANELDQLPNEKGKVKPKYEKDIKSILATDHMQYFNGGAYYFEKQDYQKAYDMFNQFLDVAELPMMQGTPTAAKDSTFMTVQFYAAVSATQLEDKSIGIKALNRAKDTPYRQNDVYQYLCYEYGELQDTVNLQKTVEEGLKLFPEEPYYLNMLINLYISSGNYDDAISKLNSAIAQRPNDLDLYNVLGRVYEDMQNYSKAEENFLAVLSKDANNIDAHSNIGRIYYNQGVNKLGEANMINDDKQYKEAVANAKELFKKALPYFEQAHKAKPEEREYMVALRGIYYNLDMGDKLQEIETALGN
jgi:tetratricopeptide (TPR) repeat protein